MSRETGIGRAPVAAGGAGALPLPPIEYGSVGSIRGPLIVVEGVADVGWNEVAEIRLADGEVRHGVVLDVDLEHAVVEVLEGTAGMRLDGARTAFGGAPMSVPVSEAWLGRVCNGRGEPLDEGPPVLGGERRYIAGAPINPAVRIPPSEPIVTGVSAIDGLATLVRGQKLPIFSVGGLPHLELAAQVAVQSHVAGEPFAVVFAALGVTHADAGALRETLETRAGDQEAVLFINTADDPVVERLMTPRVALTVAEHLAFECDRHVLTLLADVTNYAEALRQVSAARGEVPTRRGYPGYLYSDLASLFERAGRMRGRRGSLTLVPVLTMPAGDITHPVPDVTGYITEGQLVLATDIDARGVYPPLDLMGSLSRLMRRGTGAGLTRDDHPELADQLYALTARAIEAADLASRARLSQPGAGGGTDARCHTRSRLARGLPASGCRADDGQPRDARRPLPRGGGCPARELRVGPRGWPSSSACTPDVAAPTCSRASARRCWPSTACCVSGRHRPPRSGHDRSPRRSAGCGVPPSSTGTRRRGASPRTWHGRRS
jgi:V/A-type H+/Na+-transporting ATPase subunit B